MSAMDELDGHVRCPSGLGQLGRYVVLAEGQILQITALVTHPFGIVMAYRSISLSLLLCGIAFVVAPRPGLRRAHQSSY